MFNYSMRDSGNCEFIPVVQQDNFTPGERLFFEIDNIPLVLFEIAGRLFAIEDICSHDDGPVGEGELEGFEIVCPRHGARFDIRDGKALSLPAIVDIPAYPVRTNAGMIEIGIPRV